MAKFYQNLNKHSRLKMIYRGKRDVTPLLPHKVAWYRLLEIYFALKFFLSIFGVTASRYN